MIPLDFPQIFQKFPSLVAVQSTRIGGSSAAPYHSLNLGLHTADQTSSVASNRQAFFGQLQLQETQVAHSYQVHQDHILKVSQAGSYEGFDALITDQSNLFLSVTIADCTPILVYDAHRQVVAAIHAGWRGTVSKIVQKTLMKMRTAYQTQAKDCYAYIGTCIDAEHFEVGPEVAAQFSEHFKCWSPSRGKFLVDLKKANQHQLLDAGLPVAQIEISPNSTVLDNHRYFSYRHEKTKTGRMLALIGRRS